MDIPFIDQSFVAKRAIFYVGGRYYEENEKHFYGDQMFVEAYMPQKLTHPYPIIMFHGAGQTNVNWLTTPDGRMGWCDYFVSKGYCVCLAEQPARGRSAYHPNIHGQRIYHPVEVLQNRFMSDEGKWDRAKMHTQWPENRANWEDETFRQFISSQVEYLSDNKNVQRLVLEAGKELLQRTGPSILLTHSQAGPFGWLLADACPELVKGIVALEPSGPPFSMQTKDLKFRNYGITELPLHFDPPVSSIDEIELELLCAENEGERDGWVMKEPARKLPRLAGIPITILVGEASYHADTDHMTSYFLTQAGVEHDFVHLEQVGIHGNGHMMMLEKNNLEIAGWVLRWLDERVK